MKFSSLTRRITALIALFGILLTQFAVVAYACPELGAASSKPMVEVSMSEDAAMHSPGCEEIDKAQPALCQTQHHVAPQSLDKSVSPDVQPFVTASLVATLEPTAPGISESAAISRLPLLARMTAPPLSIRHCCFRI